MEWIEWVDTAMIDSEFQVENIGIEVIEEIGRVLDV